MDSMQDSPVYYIGVIWGLYRDIGIMENGNYYLGFRA